ncbi:hypothetical protein LTR70_001773 [Exophiala xenobiotica]|uniref:BTB domain-containing protein n=1 Tax=Lithohypha guttulata TaxID=1690604 RepID=A0ABR0KLZ6_9EURO|nr:hypothetical protein LTR24_001034 [Lithohypha guttulata]KAK5327031.1 hypothetical protein LTR70_001773 [Exophiala xenobiotica]
MTSILSTGEFSDFEIKCGGYVFKAHKSILSCRSPFFKAAVSNGMRESFESKIELPEDEPEVVARALIYLYTGKYESDDIASGMAGEVRQFSSLSDRYSRASQTWNTDCELCIKMYNLAGKLMLPELQAELRNIFLRAYYGHREPNYAGTSHDPLTEEGNKDRRALIELVYSTNRSFDWTFKDVLVQNAHTMIEDYGALAMKGFQDMLRDIPGFTLDVASTRLHRTRCPLNEEHRALWLEQRCNCGRSTSCDNTECNKQRSKRSACDHCVRFGVLKFPLKEGDADTT